MNEDNYLKIGCTQCGNNIEFPAEAAGQTIDCPHCGKPLALAAPKPKPAAPPASPVAAPRPASAGAAEPRVRMKPATPEWDEPAVAVAPSSKLSQVASLLAMLVGIGVGLWFYQNWKRENRLPKLASDKPKVTAAVTHVGGKRSADSPKTEPPPPKEEPEVPHTGPDLQVLKYQIERAKDKGSRLTYVTGTLTNHVKAQYFSVKVEFELFDKDGKSLGVISDQSANVAGRSRWEFKALVLDESATRAEMVKIHGEKE